MAFSITYPFKQTFIPLWFYFLRICWINLRSVGCILGWRLVYIVWHHHLINHHIFQRRPLLRCIRLQHLLLNNQLLLRRQLLKVLLRQSVRQHRPLRHLHPQRRHTVWHTRCRHDLRMAVLHAPLRHYHLLLHHHPIFILLSQFNLSLHFRRYWFNAQLLLPGELNWLRWRLIHVRWRRQAPPLQLALHKQSGNIFLF